MKIFPHVISNQNLYLVTPEENARIAACEMAKRNISSALVVDGTGVLCGIATERDMTRALVVEARDMASTTIADIMTSDPDTLSSEDLAHSALELMELRGYRHLPVIDADGLPIGVVSIRDLYATVMAANRKTLERTQEYVLGDRYNLE